MLKIFRMDILKQQRPSVSIRDSLLILDTSSSLGRLLFYRTMCFIFDNCFNNLTCPHMTIENILKLYSFLSFISLFFGW